MTVGRKRQPSEAEIQAYLAQQRAKEARAARLARKALERQRQQQRDGRK